MEMEKPEKGLLRPAGYICDKTHSRRGILIYNNSKQRIISSTSVYSVRIDSRVRKMIEEMPDQNWQGEIRALIEHSVKKKRKEYLLYQARENQNRLPIGIPASQVIREDRDSR